MTSPAPQQQADSAGLMTFIQVVRRLAVRALVIARRLDARAKAAAAEKGMRPAYVQHLQRQAADAAAGAAQIDAALRRLLIEKADDIRRITQPRNGNTAHEQAADVATALRDHREIQGGR